MSASEPVERSPVPEGPFGELLLPRLGVRPEAGVGGVRALEKGTPLVLRENPAQDGRHGPVLSRCQALQSGVRFRVDSNGHALHAKKYTPGYSSR